MTGRRLVAQCCEPVEIYVRVGRRNVLRTMFTLYYCTIIAVSATSDMARLSQHIWGVVGSLVIVLLHIFSWFWQWNNLENLLIFDDIKAYQKTVPFFGPPWGGMITNCHVIKYTSVNGMLCAVINDTNSNAIAISLHIGHKAKIFTTYVYNIWREAAVASQRHEICKHSPRTTGVTIIDRKLPKLIAK